MEKNATLKQISDIAGVSIATVSRVLTNSAEVKQETRERVMAAVDACSYVLHKKKTNLIGLVVPDLLNPFFPLLLKGIESIARIQDYRLIVCNSENNPQVESKILGDLLDIDCDGLIFIGSTDSIPRILRQIIHEKSTPVVFLDRDPGLNEINLVITDNLQGMSQSTLYLLGLGHKKILYIGGPQHLLTEQQRLLGFRKTLAIQNIPDSWQRLEHADYTLEGGYLLMERILEEGRPDFTAICSANDLMAHGAYKALVERGFKIPHDISIIGYDDIPSSEILGLTSIRQPFEEMGRKSMLELLHMLSSNHINSRRSVLLASLVIRNSCIPYKTND